MGAGAEAKALRKVTSLRDPTHEQWLSPTYSLACNPSPQLSCDLGPSTHTLQALCLVL